MAGPGKILQVGDKVPVLRYQDVSGNPGTNTGRDDYIIVYSFADRKSSKKLMDVMEESQLELVRAHPRLKLIFFNIADLSALPGALRHLIGPVLEKMNDYAMKKMRRGYEKAGVNLDPRAVELVFIPDWKGELLRAFGLRDAQDFRVFVAVRGEIAGAFDSHTPRMGEEFCRLFDRLDKKPQC
jgi:hypothetical protein